MKHLVSTSALPLSTYRRFKGQPNFKKGLYENLFRKWTKHKKAYRIYLPVTGPARQQEVSRIPPDIVKALAEVDYVVDDYSKGIASHRKSDRIMKIGKLLQKTGNPQLKAVFDNDKSRRNVGNKDSLMVVISRHPYDIAGMSTGRGWTSCTELEVGVNSRYVIDDVKGGMLVAYLIKPDDKNINRPIARTRIMRYANEENDKFILVRHPYVYGTDHKRFGATIDNWLDKINVEPVSGALCLTTPYTDLAPESINVISSLDQFKDIPQYVDGVSLKFANAEIAEAAYKSGNDKLMEHALSSREISPKILSDAAKLAGRITKKWLDRDTEINDANDFEAVNQYDTARRKADLIARNVFRNEKFSEDEAAKQFFDDTGSVVTARSMLTNSALSDDTKIYLINEVSKGGGKNPLNTLTRNVISDGNLSDEILNYMIVNDVGRELVAKAPSISGRTLVSAAKYLTVGSVAELFDLENLSKSGLNKAFTIMSDRSDVSDRAFTILCHSLRMGGGMKLLNSENIGYIILGSSLDDEHMYSVCNSPHLTKDQIEDLIDKHLEYMHSGTAVALGRNPLVTEEQYLRLASLRPTALLIDVGGWDIDADRLKLIIPKLDHEGLKTAIHGSARNAAYNQTKGVAFSIFNQILERYIELDLSEGPSTRPFQNLYKYIKIASSSGALSDKEQITLKKKIVSSGYIGLLSMMINSATSEEISTYIEAANISGAGPEIIAGLFASLANSMHSDVHHFKYVLENTFKGKLVAMLENLTDMVTELPAQLVDAMFILDIIDDRVADQIGFFGILSGRDFTRLMSIHPRLFGNLGSDVAMMQFMWKKLVPQVRRRIMSESEEYNHKFVQWVSENYEEFANIPDEIY